MSTVHVLTRTGSKFRCAIHFSIPAGNNSAGLSWKSVLLAAGRSGTTILPEGTGPGQISTVERAQVLTGDVVEFVADIEALTAGTTPAALAAMVDAEAVKLIAAYQAQLQHELIWFGALRA